MEGPSSSPGAGGSALPHSRSVFSSRGQRRSWVRQASGTASPAELSLVTRSSCCHSSWHLTARLCSPGLMDLFGAFTGAELERDNMGGGSAWPPVLSSAPGGQEPQLQWLPGPWGTISSPQGGTPCVSFHPKQAPSHLGTLLELGSAPQCSPSRLMQERVSGVALGLGGSSDRMLSREVHTMSSCT